MTADNFASTLSGLQRLNPFRVFTVELNGGRRFEVDHPGALVVRDGVAVFLAPGGVPIWFDHESVNQIIGGVWQIFLALGYEGCQNGGTNAATLDRGP
ncbi:hypothetical protein [Fimbriiglobus ruber]|uniref:hypothetical protein n=1 Tax=Fimbriiglobus ruber TaxID=1908690 RepID=UPI000B4A5A9B|nr:hypothetical protein [Fimbriiglobus ruber]